MKKKTTWKRRSWIFDRAKTEAKQIKYKDWYWRLTTATTQLPERNRSALLITTTTTTTPLTDRTWFSFLTTTTTTPITAMFCFSFSTTTTTTSITDIPLF